MASASSRWTARRRCTWEFSGGRLRGGVCPAGLQSGGNPQLRRLPTCGAAVTRHDGNRGGPPLELSCSDAVVQGKGVYIEELEQAIPAQGLQVPPFYGLALGGEFVDPEKIIADFRAFLESVM